LALFTSLSALTQENPVLALDWLAKKSSVDRHTSVLMIDNIVIFRYTDSMPQKSSTQKGGTPRMRRLIISLPEETHKALKVYAAENYTTIREFVTEAIDQALKKKGGEKAKK
jgi:hypothetical protein